jgi:sugar phosphate permease
MNQTDATNKAKRYRYLVCLAVFLAYVMVFFHRLCPAVIALDMQQSFQVGGTLLGVLGSAYFYPYALMQIPTGLLADSWGPRKTVASFLVLAAIGAVLMGLAPNLGLAVAGRLLVGVGVSTVFVCNFKLLAEWFSPRRYTVMGGLFTATGGLGALGAGSPLAFLSESLGWRGSLVAVGVSTAAIAALVWLVVRDRPQDKGWPSLRTEPAYQPEPAGPGARIGLWAGMRQVVGAARFWSISLWGFMCIGISFALIGLWGGPYLMQAKGLSKAEAGLVLNMSALALVAGGPLLALIANRVGRKKVILGVSILLCLALLPPALAPQAVPGWLLYVLFFCYSLCGGATGPVIATVSKELFPISIAGTSVGMVNLFPFFGAAAFQIAMGAIVSQTSGGVAASYQAMFLFSLGCAVTALIFACFVRETLGRTWEDIRNQG